MKSNSINMLFVRAIVLLLCSACLVSCGLFKKKRSHDVVAECCGKKLMRVDIERLTEGYTGDDSTAIANAYIENWAVELLMYESSHRVASREIEELVEDYRRSLYINEYEQLLVSQRMEHNIADSLIENFYAEHKENLILKEMIVKGALLVVPNEAPNMSNLRKQLSKLPSNEAMEWVEKYVYQYGVGYELFADTWKQCNEIASYIPVSKDELMQMVRKEKLVEVRDSLNTYLLEVVDYYGVGSVMPLDYARKEIEDNILRTRSREFIKNTRKELYNKSLKNGKVKRYED